MKVIGKDENALSSLKEKLQSMPVPIKKKLKVHPQPSDDFSPEDDFFTSPPKKENKKIPIPKVKSGLNCNDMFFLFQSLWRGYGFPGQCTAWTMRDRKNIKDLIAEQGDSAVVAYIKYCLQNWKELCHRYKIMSVCPTIPILYGYRRSLLPEALDPAKKQNHTGAEFTETDIQSGSWS